MDNSMLWILGVIFFVCILTYFVSNLRKKDILTTEDLLFVQHLFSLTVAVIDELNIKNEKKVLQISNVVLSALEYATKVSKGDDNVVELALQKCYELCGEMDIELTESRKLIIMQFINLGLMNRYTNSNGRYLLNE